jgi:hypothetical protein
MTRRIITLALRFVNPNVSSKSLFAEKKGVPQNRIFERFFYISLFINGISRFIGGCE